MSRPSITKTVDDIESLGEELETQLPKELQEQVEINREIGADLQQLAHSVESSKRKEIEDEIEKAVATGNFKIVEQKMLDLPHIRGNKKLEDRVRGATARQEALGETAYQLEKLQKMGSLARYRDLFDVPPGAAIPVGKLFHTFYKEENGQFVARTKEELAQLEMKRLEERAQREGKEVSSLRRWAGGLKWWLIGAKTEKHIKRYESTVNQTSKTMGGIKKTAEQAQEIGQDVGEQVTLHKQGFDTTKEALARNPEVRRRATIDQKRFQAQSKAVLDTTFSKVVNHRNPDAAMEKLTKLIGADNEKIMNASPEYRQERLKAIVKKKDSIRRFKRAGGSYVLAIAVDSIKKGLKERDYKAAIDNLDNANIWKEMAPYVGTTNNTRRLFTDNGDPVWAKVAVLGLDLYGDISLTMGIVGAAFTGGGSLALGAGTKALTSGIGKWVMKFATRKGVKEVTETAVKAGVQTVAKKTMTQAVVKEGAQKGMVRQVIRVGSKEISNDVIPIEQAVKKANGQIVKKKVEKGALRQAAGFTAVNVAIEETIDRTLPTEKIKDMSIQVAEREARKAIEPKITPGMRRLYEVASRGKEMAAG